MDKANLFFGNIKKFFTKKRIVWALVIVIAAVIVAALEYRHDQAQVSDYLTVTRGNVQKSAIASGNVLSTTDLKLSFQQSDVVKAVNVKLGDKVKKGAVIATLNNAAQEAAVLTAQGQLLGAQARLRKVREGATATDVSAAQTALDSASFTQQQLVENARRKLFSDNLVAEPVFPSMDPTKAPIISGAYLGSQPGQYHLSFDNSITQLSYTGLESGTLQTLTVAQPLGKFGLTLTFPVSSYGYNNEWTVNIPNTHGANYAANLNAYNSAVAAGEETIANAKSHLDVVGEASRPADIQAAQADVLVAQGALESAQAAFDKTIIKAPADGTITRIDIHVGDLATMNVPVITLEDVTDLYVEADVNESSVLGVAIGQPVTLTFDALGKDKTFTGKVSSLDTGATNQGDVVNYKVDVSLDSLQGVLPGMTSDIVIRTAFAGDVINIPSRYVSVVNGDHVVYVVPNQKNPEQRERRVVTLGLRDDNGNVEIKSGLNAGEQIAIVTTSGQQ